MRRTQLLSRGSAALLRLCLLVILGLAAAACVPMVSVDVSIDLKKDEAWEALVVVVAPPNEMAASEIQSQLNQNVAYLQQQGVSASWARKDADSAGNFPFELRLSGQGFERFNQAFAGAGGQWVIQDAQTGNIKFEMLAASFPLLLNTQSSKVTLNGGSVVATNGSKQDGNSVVWINPTGVLQAEMKPPGAFPWLLVGLGVLLLAGAGAVVLAVGGGLMMRAKAAQPAGGVAGGVALPVASPFAGESDEPLNRAERLPERPPQRQPAAPQTALIDEEDEVIVRARQAVAPVAPPAAPPIAPSAGQETSAALFCGYCGRSIPAQAIFCPGCGKKRVI